MMTVFLVRDTCPKCDGEGRIAESFIASQKAFGYKTCEACEGTRFGPMHLLSVPEVAKLLKERSGTMTAAEVAERTKES